MALGQTYIEVRPRDIGESWALVEGIDSRSTAVYFVDELTDLCYDELWVADDSWYGSETKYFPPDKRCDVADVVACLPNSWGCG